MRLKIPLVFMLFIVPTIMFAQEGKHMGLHELIQQALSQNPQILAAHARYEAARARVAFFRNLPDPMLEYGYDKLTPSSNGKPMKTLSVTQEIPFPTKLFLKRKAAKQEMDSFQQEYRETQQRVIKEVKEAYTSMFVANRKLALTKGSLALASQMSKAAETRYSSGRGSQVDALRAGAEQDKAMVAQKQFEQDRIIAQGLLASILNMTPKDLSDIDMHMEPTDEDATEENIIDRIRQDRPELKSFRNMLDKAKTEYSLSKQELLPDIRLEYKHEDQGGNFSRGQWMGAVGLTIPLWFWGKQGPEIAEARAGFKAAQADYQAEENTVLFEGRSALAKVKASGDIVRLYEDGILPRIKSAVTTARVAYESGTGEFSEYIGAFRAYRDYQMEYADALATLAVSKADLERVVGGDMDSEGEMK
ncbi:MAG: TolC family protein [Candidatus Omnitrophica bacterium]|nr:TolC family protein [Candidatus Omnitrophota bacterium]